MNDDSFDPRSWAKPPPGAAPQPPEAVAKPVEAGAKPVEANESALPEAWRDIGSEFAATADTKPAAKTKIDSPKRPSRHGPSPLAKALPYAASIILLASGGAAAWVTRAPVELPPEAVAAAEPEVAVPGVVERSLVLASLADIVGALTAAGVSPQEAAAAAQAAAKVLSGSGEIHATLELMPQGQGFLLQRLKASFPDGSGAVVARNEEGAFAGSAVAAELTKQIKVARGEIDTESFYTSAVAAGVIDTLIPEFINAFAYDFNLASEVHPGDTFEVAFEQSINAQGDPVGQPQLLFASLTTPLKSLALYRFRQPDGKVAWFDGNGAITQRGLMRTPVDGARITSKFGPRFHPVLHYTRLHGGVDFAAPVGTPIYAASGGTIASASPSGCAGNMVVMTHDNGWSTRYFHLSKYADGLHAGQRVEQGFTIGAVGNTGTCTTGPHLHYEVHIDGEKVDPLSIKTDDAQRKKLDSGSMPAFLSQRDRVDVARAQNAI